jgi:Tfp pilus assembly protein PilO
MQLNQKVDINVLISKLLSQKEYLVTVVIFIIAFNIATKLYKSQNNRLNSIKEEISVKEKEIEYLNGIKAQQGQIEKLKENFKQIELSDLVNRVTETANQFGLKILTVDEQKKTDSNLFIVLSFRISLEGKYHDIGRFLSEIENFEEFTKVDNITLSPRDDNKESRGNITANISIVCTVLK